MRYIIYFMVCEKCTAQKLKNRIMRGKCTSLDIVLFQFKFNCTFSLKLDF